MIHLLNNQLAKIFPRLPVSLSVLLRVWPVVLFWILLGALDLQQRLLWSFGNNKQIHLNERSASHEGPLILNRSQYEDYLLKISTDNDDAEAAPELLAEVEDDLSLDVNGNESWGTSNYRFRLLGIFEAADKFAVLNRISLSTAEQDLIDVRVGDEIDGFLIKAITTYSITAATEVGERMEMTLFQPSRFKDEVLQP
ncbi:hypothetical protein N9R09_00955 [Porticoccaceae bacterium]|nr:hypothetical protein [Porticoccaceae bacterium]